MQSQSYWSRECDPQRNVKKPACYSVLLLPVANFIVDSTTDGYGVHIYMLEMCVLMRLEDELTDEKGKTS